MRKTIIVILIIAACSLFADPIIGIGYQIPVGRTYFGMSLNCLDVIPVVGIGWYVNIYGVGNLGSSDAYDYPYAGDELKSTYEIDSWGAMSYGLNMKIKGDFYGYMGYCDGEKYHTSGETYYDEYHILDPSGYYDVEYTTVEKNPGVDLGLFYTLKKWEPVHLHIIGGYNSSLNTAVVGLAVGVKISI